MTDHIHLHNGTPHDDEHAALVTAFALGQLAGEEERAIEAQVARSPQLKRQVEEIRRLTGQLTDGLRADPLPAASATLAEKVADQLDFATSMQVALPPKKRTRWLEVMIGVAVCGSVAVLMLPAVQSSRESSRKLAATMQGREASSALYSELDELQDGDRVNYNYERNFAPSSRPAKAAKAALSTRSQWQGSGLPDDGYSTQAADDKATLFLDSVHPGAKNPLPVSGSGPAPHGLGMKPNHYGAEPAPRAMFGIGVNSDAGATGTKKTPDRETLMVPGPGVGGPGPGVLQPPKATLYNGQQGVASDEYRFADRSAGGRKMVREYSPEEKREKQLATDSLSVASGKAEPLGEAKVDYDHPAPHPADPAGAEQYDQIIENTFQAAKAAPLSTFSIDVDTASYANTRRFLTSGQRPPASAVRIEELINYFSYDDPQPQGNAPFSANMEIAECPWSPGHHLLRIGLKGKEMNNNARPNSNLVFLLDVSGSMAAENKLPLVKQAMQMLVRELRENDSVTIVTYAGTESLALDSTPGDQKEKINKAIESLGSGGSTQGSAGIILAYEKAKEHFIKDGANRVILCTDGDFNVGVTSDEALVDLITTKAKSGVFLSVLGFGMGNLKDSKMEKLADKGNGNYAYIDTLREGRKVLVEEMASNLVTIAKDVKIQIEFNPATIAAYRQIGYENRVLAAKDFNDDTKDAGEIGAGHSVTALYEVVLVGNEKQAAPLPEGEIPLKYQKSAVKAETPADKPAELALTEEAASGELLTLKLRFKAPDGDKSELIEFPLKQQPKKFGAASENLRFASAVAAFGMLLRDSDYRGGATMSAVEEIAAASLGKDPSGYRTEFLDLVRKAGQLTGN